MFAVPPRCLLLIVSLAWLVGCSTPTPPSTPTVVPTLSPPTSTPVPPTVTVPPAIATVTPTRTPVPVAKVNDLLLALNPELTGAQADQAMFDFGGSTLYAQLDYQGMPNQFSFPWTLTREGRKIAEGTVHPTQSTGLITFAVTSAAGPLLPNDYRLTVRAFSQIMERRFTIKSDRVLSGTQILSEDFLDNDNNWTLYNRTDGASRINEGQLQIQLLKKDSWANGVLPIDIADFDLSVDINFEDRSDPVAVIFFRSSAGAGYELSLEPTGHWLVAQQTTDGYDTLTDWQPSKTFNPHGTNRVRIVAAGSKMAFYMNNSLLGALDNSVYSHGGILLGALVGKGDNALLSYDNLELKTPGKEVALVPTAVAAAQSKATSVPKATVLPEATAVPKTPPLADAIRKALKQVESLGGAMDRLYGGSGAEACEPFMADFFGVLAAPKYDVATQPSNVQGAYAAYRQAINLIADKVSSIAEVCLKGGGVPSRLSFDVARMAVNDAGSLLTNALSTLGQ